MGLIFSYRYQHHDPHLLEPVENELRRRGHLIERSSMDRFIASLLPKVLLLAADHMVSGHAAGVQLVNECRMRGIRSVSLQHGAAAAFPNPDDPPMHCAADVRCLWGDFWKRWFVADELVVTGAPHMDFWETQPKVHALLVPCFREDAKQKQLASLTTAQRAEVYLKMAQTFGRESWIIRPHPSDWTHNDRIELCRKMARDLNGTVSNRARLLPDLAPAELVLGTSTVVFEGLAVGAKAVPLFMDYLPLKLNRNDLLGPLDGGATGRVADVVEQCLGS